MATMKPDDVDVDDRKRMIIDRVMLDVTDADEMNVDPADSDRCSRDDC